VISACGELCNPCSELSEPTRRLRAKECLGLIVATYKFRVSNDLLPLHFCRFRVLVAHFVIAASLLPEQVDSNLIHERLVIDLCRIIDL
jgi:hypothetical protein